MHTIRYRKMSRVHTDAHVRWALIAAISFLTLVDLFATQAILPSLAVAYDVPPGTIGTAVNASTLGMAIAGVVIALVGRSIDRRRGIWISLALLAIPTSLLATAGDIATFAALRFAQGLCMSTAFTLTMAYLAEHCSGREAAAALAAYITGNVASNLFGRLMAGALAEYLGLAPNFYVFAVLNLVGAALAYFSLRGSEPAAAGHAPAGSPFDAWRLHLRNPQLRASFGIGFLILFAFIGTFTYVNFVLAAAPISLSPMSLGLVYFVFLPSLLTTPLAGGAAARLGTRATFWAGLAIAAAGLPLLLVPQLTPVLLGMVLLAVGTFFAQATATGFVSRVATTERGAASGLYLASYYIGGLAGSAALGQIFGRFGWHACVIGIGLALALAAVLALRLHVADGRPAAEPAPANLS